MSEAAAPSISRPPFRQDCMAIVNSQARRQTATLCASGVAGDQAVLTMSVNDLRAIRKHAARAFPEEACGGLLGWAKRNGDVRVCKVVPLINACEEDRARRYLIGPSEVLELERCAQRLGLEVVGFYHSHPHAPAAPSDFDLEQAWPWYVYLILGEADGGAAAAAAWRLAEDPRRFRELAISVNPEVHAE